MTTHIEIINPATGAKISQLPVATVAEVAENVQVGRRVQTLWREQSFESRAKTLFRFRDLLLDRQEELAAIITGESGKPRAEVYGTELFYVCDGIGFWAKTAAKYLRRRRINPHLMKAKKVFSIYEPAGVVGIISPWNFPLVLTIGEAIPALMAGNAVVIKPSELTPLTAVFGARIAEDAGLPRGLLQVVNGRGDTGAALVDCADMISFTGSVETGKEIVRRAAERLIPVSLELGGKDPMIVLKDADIERAANACVWGSLMNSGQVCTSVERVYVEEPLYKEFVQLVTEKVAVLRQGNSDGDLELGGMTSPAQVEKIEAQIADAVQKGARILTGGRRSANGNGFHFPPTVLVDVTHDMIVMTEETFGPLIPIMKVKDKEEALRFANDSRYGLDSSIFTRDSAKGWEIAQQLETGAVCINDSLINFVIPEAPMGGIKDSGYSRRHGAEGIRKYCRQKTIIVDRFGLKTEFNWFPSPKEKVNKIRALLNLMYRSGWKNKLAALARLLRA